MAKNKKDESTQNQDAQQAVEQKEESTAPAPEANEELEAKMKECEELRDRYMRTAAEYDNFRKRTARERETLYADAASSTIGEFLAVYDNLERALEMKTEDEAFFRGVEMIFAGLCETLEKLKVEVINPLHEAFDPQLHNAVMHVEDEAVDENTVVEVFQKGFRRGERVIRHAIVKVAN